MKNYRIMLDISSIFGYIKHLNLRSYNSPFPTIFISAIDPDDACCVALEQLIKIIIDQDSTLNTRILCRRIKRICRIDKIYELG
jgi:hypothetical protein